METINEAQTPVAKGGRMPVDTGRLRGSLKTSVYGRSNTSAKGAAAYFGLIRGVTVQDTVEVAWTVNYAAAVEFGRKNKETGARITKPARFMRGAMDNWENNIKAGVRRVKSRGKIR